MTHEGNDDLNLEKMREQVEGYLAYMDTLGFREGPIGVFARTRAKPGRAGEIIATIKSWQDVVRAEPGTLFYGLFPDVVDENLIHTYQLYADRAALHVHFRDERYLRKMSGIVDASDGPPEYCYSNPEYFVLQQQHTAQERGS